MSRLLRPRGGDQGVALVLVIGSMLVVAMLALTALAYTLNSKDLARMAQDRGGSLAAAEAGIQDYIARLNRNDVYDQTLDCTNPALQGPLTGTVYTSGCGYGPSTAIGWAPVVQGTTDPAAAYFHYALVGRNQAEQTLTIQSTGRVNGRYRTVEAVVGKGGSTDYVYYTDFEDADPSNVQAYPPAGATTVACGSAGYGSARYFYQGRSGCQEITFIAADRLNGPVFSNDAVLSNGGNFEDGFSSPNPTCQNVTSNPSTWNNCLRSGSTANFNGVQPRYADPLYLNDTSAQFAGYPGCKYFGSTRIRFNANGTMTVWNKTVTNGNTAPVAVTTAGQPTPSCGSLADLNHDNGATVNVPTNMTIYAAPAPASVTRRQCYAGQLGGPSGQRLPVGTLSATQAAPSTGLSYTADVNMAETTKFCAEGNLYVEGTVRGRVTMASAQSIIVTGDLVLAGGHGGQDLVGLVATNSVEVFNPRLATYTAQRWYANCNPSGSGSLSWQYCPGATSTVSGWPRRYVDPTTGTNNPNRGIQIAASIQTLQHSFLVQKYNDTDNVAGNMPLLYVKGSIAQRWRGIVGRTSGSVVTGYAKLYDYDRRLLLSAPPYFPRWVNAQWLTRYSGEMGTPDAIKV
ncbi:MAG TPA: hypothetical protein PKB06_05420, partial [Actinotalea sp.]|nr:hypothetical protein [Actinotalea sp.]